MDLQSIANHLACRGKGLLASDESTGTIGKRFEKVGVENTEENRRAYRELFYTANVGNYYSGAIMYKETLYQKAHDGRLFTDCLAQQGVYPGIKVDEGLVPLVGESQQGETSTKGLDNLEAACREYVKAGAKFTKWRAVLKVGPGLPSEQAVQINAEQLAKYAQICQACSLVPVVEPEILIDGDHSIGRFAEVSEQVISRCIAQLWAANVQLEGCLLKPQMVIPGAEHAGPKPSPKEVAEHTLRTMRRVVPPAIPGIMFLSGGQSEEEATINLNAINQMAQSEGRAPWSLSFSYGRALQASVLKIWAEDRTATAEAKHMVEALAAANAAAATGSYHGTHPSLLLQGGNLREAFRGWGQQQQPAAPAHTATA